MTRQLFDRTMAIPKTGTGNTEYITLMVSSLFRTCGIGMTLCLLSCATISRHQFAAPGSDWQTRTGQLMYRNAATTLIGDVIVRSSPGGELELTFSKGPGLSLLTFRQDSAFAEVKGAMAGPGWSGPIERAPRQLRGWLALREKIVQAPYQEVIRHTEGSESFVIRF